MGEVFKIILYAVLLFYVFELIINLIYRHKIRKLKEMEAQDAFHDETSSDEGTKKPHIDPNIGEYTDFEEIE